MHSIYKDGGDGRMRRKKVREAIAEIAEECPRRLVEYRRPEAGLVVLTSAERLAGSLKEEELDSAVSRITFTACGVQLIPCRRRGERT
ncbi:MAG: hypothetical protein J6K32_08255 [Clostridia bacterium]|nr:hypothetical protein [Clostridia bacterium]